jgi:hypothetical protein
LIRKPVPNSKIPARRANRARSADRVVIAARVGMAIVIVVLVVMAAVAVIVVRAAMEIAVRVVSARKAAKAIELRAGVPQGRLIVVFTLK